MRRAYEVRSAIVHGAEPKSKYLIGLDGRGLDLREFANEAERLIRVMLRQAVLREARGEPVAGDWEARLFPR